MNLILVEPGEVGSGGCVRLDGRRAAHIRGVLRAEPGARLRVGLIDGPRGSAEVRAARGDGVELVCAFEPAAPADPPPLDVALAMPRPKTLCRLLAALASFAVRRVFLLNAARVERSYFDSHSLAPDAVRRHLLEGCEQAGWTRLPRVTVHRRFRAFLEEELEAPAPDLRRLVAHPGAGGRVRDAVEPGAGVLLAVGPDGGWSEFERETLAARGFRAVCMPGGPLRTDVACLALMALARDRQVA